MSAEPSWPDRVRAPATGIRSADSSLATNHQRLALRCELRQQDYPTDVVTVMHRDLFAAADVPWREGRELDAELSTFTRVQASRLLSHLKGAA